MATLALMGFLAGCQPLPTPEGAIKENERVTGSVAPGQITKADLVGAWHAAPSVGAGYNQRRVFKADGSFAFYPSEYDKPKEYTSYEKIKGRWSLEGKQLIIHSPSVVMVGLDGRFAFLDGPREKEIIPLGGVENESPDVSPYGHKMTFNGIYFWKYSDDPAYWEKEAQAQESDLVGAWLQSSEDIRPYRERYLFKKDKTVVFRHDQVSGDKWVGEWALAGNELRISYRAKLSPEGKEEKIEDTSTIPLGPLIQPLPVSSRNPKMTLGGIYFWKYSDDPAYWDEKDSLKDSQTAAPAPQSKK